MLAHANHYCRYADLWEAHLRTALLDALPKAQRELDVVDHPFEPPMSASIHYLDFLDYVGADIRGSWLCTCHSYCARSYASRFRARIGRVPSRDSARVCRFTSFWSAYTHPSPFFLAFLLEILTFGLDSGTTLQAQKGHIVLTPYAVVQQLLTMGLVELV